MKTRQIKQLGTWSVWLMSAPGAAGTDVTLCVQKSNDDPPIAVGDVAVTVRDDGGATLAPERVPSGGILDETRGFATTASAVFGFRPAPGRVLRTADVRIGDATLRFDLTDV